MLRQNPKGGKPLARYGGIDWDETYAGFQYKLGYCQCSKKILVTADELAQIVNTFSYMSKKRYLVKGIARFLLRQLA